jgi:hypothetical protein
MDHRFAWRAQRAQNGRDDSNSPLRLYSFSSGEICRLPVK